MVFAEPPEGASNVTVAIVAVVALAITLVGASIYVFTEGDSDASDVPLLFVAVIKNVYAVLGDKPDTSIGEDVPMLINPPGELVTV
jgi:hypothetical protein